MAYLPSARLEHIGIAVDDVTNARGVLDQVLRLFPYKVEEVRSEQVRTHFVDAGGAKIELLESLDADSAIGRHLERRGAGLHHLAFEVDDIGAAHERMHASGFRVLNEAPKSGADAKRIFFLHPKDTFGVLVELCSSTRPEIEPSFTQVGDLDVAYVERGAEDAPPVVLLHGIAGGITFETYALAQQLERRYRVVAIDLPGHGFSDDPDAAVSFDLFHEACNAVLEATGIDAAHWYGFSMGGAVALEQARRRPETVLSVTAHSTRVAWSDEGAARMSRRLTPELIERRVPELAGRYAEAHGEQWADRLRALQPFAESLGSALAEVEVISDVDQPALIMAVDEDPFFSVDLPLRQRDALPNARLCILPGSDHALAAPGTDAVASTLSRFIDAHPRSR